MGVTVGGGGEREEVSATGDLAVTQVIGGGRGGGLDGCGCGVREKSFRVGERVRME